MISFGLTDDQKLAQSVMGEFAREVLRPAARAVDDAGAIPPELLGALWDAGLTQAQAGEDAAEQPTVMHALLLEELSAGDAAFAMAAAGSLGFAKAIAEQGSERQRQAILPLYAQPKFRAAAVAVADDGFFRSTAEIRATATKTAGGYRLHGRKAMLPLAGQCSHFLVVATCDGSPDAFIVEAGTPNLRVAPAKGTLGLRALQMAELELDGVELPTESRLGENRGCNVQRLIDSARVALSAILTGISRSVLEYALPYAKERVVHGEAIARKQSIAFKLADMHIDIAAMRWMGLRAAAELDRNACALRQARLAQRFAGDHAMVIADEGLQIFGGHGFTREYPLELWYRHARSISVLEGAVGA